MRIKYPYSKITYFAEKSNGLIVAAILNMTYRHQDRGTTEAKTGPLRPILPRSWLEVGEKTVPFVQIQNC